MSLYRNFFVLFVGLQILYLSFVTFGTYRDYFAWISRDCGRSWLLADDVSNVVLVDWSSSIPFLEYLPSDPRIHVIRVQNESGWNLAKAVNVAAFRVCSEWILKLSPDSYIEKLFVAAHAPLPRNGFYFGAWHRLTVNGLSHLAGAIFIRRKDFVALNGYNEHPEAYGWEDYEFCRRARAYGLEGHGFRPGYISPVYASTTSGAYAPPAPAPAAVNLEEAIARSSSSSSDSVTRAWAAQPRCEYSPAEPDLLLHDQIFIMDYLRRVACPLPDALPSSIRAVSAAPQGAAGEDRNAKDDSREELLDELRHLPTEEYLDALRDLLRRRWQNVTADGWPLMLDAQRGLGSRVRAIASALAVANATGRALVVVWAVDEQHMPASFRDLFRLGDCACIVVSDYPRGLLRSPRVLAYDYMQYEHRERLPPAVNTSFEGLVFVRTAYRLRHAAASELSIRRAARLLQPSAEVARLYEDALSELGGAPVVARMTGLHIQHQASEVYNERPQDARPICSPERFADAIAERLRENLQKQFFVASNSRDAVGRLLEQLGNKSLALLFRCTDRTTRCMQLALVDMLLLALTRSFLGSTDSSAFSEASHLLSTRSVPPAFACGVYCAAGRIILLAALPAALDWQDARIAAAVWEALTANLRHPEVAELHLLHEADESVSLFWKLPDACGRAFHHRLEAPLTFARAFRLAAGLGDSLVLLLPPHLALAYGFELVGHPRSGVEDSLRDDEIMALSSWKTNNSCGASSSCVNYRPLDGALPAHDAYLFVPSPRLLDETLLRALDFSPFDSLADAYLLHALKRAGYRVTNPCRTLILQDRDCSGAVRDRLSQIGRSTRGRVKCDADPRCADGYVFDGPSQLAARFPHPVLAEPVLSSPSFA